MTTKQSHKSVGDRTYVPEGWELVWLGDVSNVRSGVGCDYDN